MSDSLKKMLRGMNVLDEELFEEHKETLSLLEKAYGQREATKHYKKIHKEKKMMLEENKVLLEEKKVLLEEKKVLLEKNEGLSKQVAGLIKRKSKVNDIPVAFVVGVSTAAKDDKKRKAYYAKYLDREEIRGGYVAHSLFVEFVKGLRGSFSWREEAKNEFRGRAAALVQALQCRNDRSFLAEYNPNLEAPQSLVASELLGMAVRCAAKHLAPENKSMLQVFVSHQGEIKRGIHDASMDSMDSILINTGTKVVEYIVDILATVVNNGMMKIIAAIEYKPEQGDNEVRLAQRDMYATNTISLHQRPCIGIDIVGGNEVEKWVITAMAYFANPNRNRSLYQTSEMYKGTGIDALFTIGLGLCKASMNVSDKVTEQRLGPVVARHDNIVLKVYDNAKFRQPNVDVVQKMFDKKVEMWTSEDETVQIVQTKYIECCWGEDQVSSKVFADIISKLIVLHENQWCHGDMRLANLLYHEKNGFIIDFDFVRRKKYPRGLQNLTVDGKRHEDVVKAINDDSIDGLQIKVEHDWFSLQAVMDLFSCVERENEKVWDSAKGSCYSKTSEGEHYDPEKALEWLEKKEFMLNIGVGEFSEPFATGPTPEKPKAPCLASVSEEKRD